MRRWIIGIIAVLALLAALPVWAEGEEITVLFTHDLHDHLDAYDDGEREVGGIARMKALIESLRAERGDAILVDGGDFSMGGVYQTLFTERSVVLETMGDIGYDAVTLGNHEFDLGRAGLADMLTGTLESARRKGVALPALTITNLIRTGTEPDDQRLNAALERFGAAETILIERGGLKIGIFGLFGEDAIACSPNCGARFDPFIERAKAAVDQLKGEGAELIVCLSHCGTKDTYARSEDERLADAAPGIDVIVSAHSHTVLEKPIARGDTQIVSCGCYARYVGALSLRRNARGRYDAVDYAIYPVTADSEPDAATLAALAEDRRQIDEEYMNRFGYTCDRVLARNAYRFTPVSAIMEDQRDDALGDLIADAYIYAIERAEGEGGVPVDIAVTATGIIRGTLPVGEITAADAFDVCSLGVGEDGLSGYPLATAYLTGREIRDVAELDATVSALKDNVQLFPSGVGWAFNIKRLPFNKVTEVYAIGRDGQRAALEDDKLYRVAMNKFMIDMIPSATQSTYGLLNFTLKDASGKPIADTDSRVVRDAQGNELKEWVALANYLESFEPVNGLPEVPARYAAPQGRRAIADSLNPAELFKSPNKATFIALAALIVLLALALWIARLIVRLAKRVVWRKKPKKI